jgi:hypothetical protein
LKNTQIPNLMKIRLVGAELSHADGQTGGQIGRQTDRQTGTHDEANNRSSQFWQKSTYSFSKIMEERLLERQELKWKVDVCVEIK